MWSLRFILPLLIFAGLAFFLSRGLQLRPSEIPSPLIGKAAPQVTVPRLDDPSVNWSPADMKGKVWLFNVWGSWCPECRVEHPVLNDFARRNAVPIVGFAWKDTEEKARRWLDQLGNPYAISLLDREGRSGIEFGVYGAPETFVIDRDGIIRDKVIGGLTPAILEKRILPLLQKLQGS